MSTKMPSIARRAESSDAELFKTEFGHLKNHKTTRSGPSKWAGVAMSIQHKKNVGQKYSSVIWIDAEISRQYGIDVQAGLRFIIYCDGKRMMIESAPKGSNQGVKANIGSSGTIAINWNTVPKTMRLEEVKPTTVTDVRASSQDGAIQLAWYLPEWFFARKEEAAE